jgi:Cu/Ag efflux pump CusA
MSHWLVSASIKFRLIVLTLAAGVLAFGVALLPQAAVDVLPEFTPPYVEIQTEALGLSAVEVEQLITVPLEADLLNGVEGVDIIRSRSAAGLSSVVMVFNPETDIQVARARVQERMTQAHALPQVSRPPTMLQPLSSSSRLLMVSLDSDKLTPVERSVIARWTVRPTLMGIPGVANVAIWGQRERQLQIQVDPAVLQAKGVTLRQIVETAGNAQIVSPLSFLEASTPGTGGFIETTQQRLQVRHVMDALATPAELGKIPIDETESRLRLADVATIVEDHQPLIGEAVVGGQGEGLLLVVEKFPGADTAQVTADVEAALENLKPGLSGMQMDSSLFRPASYLSDALGTLGLAVVLAAVLIILGLAAWFLDWRVVLLNVVCIPVALTAAALVIYWRNETFSAITFAGLAAAAVLVVNDAVSAADSVSQDLREHTPAANRTVGLVAAFARSLGCLGYATLIALLSIVPVVVAQGRPGAFFEPLALAYALGAVASLLVASTVAPALASLLFAGARSSGSRFARRAQWYGGGLEHAIRRPKAALAVAGVLTVFVGLALVVANPSLVPTFRDRDVAVRLQAAPGTSLPAMTTAVTETTEALKAVPGVESVGAHVGRAITGDQIVDVNSSDLWVRIGSDADYDATLSGVENVLAGRTGMSHQIEGYAGQRIRAVGAVSQGNDEAGADLDALTGTSHPLVVRVYGEDLTVMRAKAEEIRSLVAGIPGVVNPRTLLPQTQESVEIQIDMARAQALGLKPGDVRRAEATLVQGIQVGSIFEGQKVFDVIVMGTPATRNNVESIRNLIIDTPTGGHVRLADLAEVRVRQTPTVIERDAVARRLDVVADLDGLSVSGAAEAARAAISGVEFPLEHHAEVLTVSTDSELDATRVIWFAIGALLAVFLLLQAACRSWRLGALAMLSLPAALAGTAFVVLVQGLSLGAVAGGLAIVGVAATNALLLFRGAQQRGLEPGIALNAAVHHAARSRLSGVVGSAICIGLMALPFALMGPRAGLEILHPMSVAVLAGLVSSTLIALFALPAIFLPGSDQTPGRHEVSRARELAMTSGPTP